MSADGLQKLREQVRAAIDILPRRDRSSLREIARQMGIDPATLSRVWRGLQEPTAQTVAAMQRWLEAHPTQAAQQSPDAEVHRLTQALALAAVRLEILTGRMRACHEETGKHRLLEEAESFCQEARRHLAGGEPYGDVGTPAAPAAQAEVAARLEQLAQRLDEAGNGMAGEWLGEGAGDALLVLRQEADNVRTIAAELKGGASDG